MARLRLAVYSAAGCGGCDISLLDVHEHLLELAEAADIVFWPTAMDVKRAEVEAMPDDGIDFCLVNGAIRTAEDAEMARLLRRKSRMLVAFGACASAGGIPGLAGLHTTAAVLERALSGDGTPSAETPSPHGRFENGEAARLPALIASAGPLSGVVEVDLVVPGCAPVAEQVWAVCEALLAGVEPSAGVAGAGTRSVCDECALAKRGTRVRAFVRPHEIEPEPGRCLLEQGVVCLGPATRSGCGARCARVAMPCRGCYGPTPGAADAGASMIGVLGTIVDATDEEAIRDAVARIVDPAGTFYAFTLPVSILGRGKDEEEAP